MSRTGLLCILIATIVAPSAFGQGGPPGATVRDLVVSAGNPSLLFVATDRGVFRSVSSGAIWAPLNDGLPVLEALRIAGTGDVLYAALGDQGVYRLRQDGTWEPSATGLEGETILSVETPLDDAATVYAGTANSRIFKSVDGGQSWQSTSQGLGDGIYHEITVSPIDPLLLFASNVNAQGTTGRLYRTVDGGAHWEPQISGPATFLAADFSRSSHGEAWVASSAGLFYTGNFGGQFTGPILPNLSIRDVLIDPADSQIIYAGTSGASTLGAGVVKSVDGGASWTVSGLGLPLVSVNRLEFASGAIFVGLVGSGVYRSPDDGATWSLSSAGMHAAAIPALTVDPANGMSLIASTAGANLFRSMTGGAQWGESRPGLNTFQVVSLESSPVSPGLVYAGTVNPFDTSDGSFLRSDDGGGSWETLFTGQPVYAIAPHPTEAGVVYIGSTTDVFGNPGLIRAQNGGTDFEFLTGLAGWTIADVEVDPADPRNLYAIAVDPFTNAYQFVWSRDEGINWQGAGLTATPFYDLAVDPADPSRVYAGTAVGFFVSADRGENFTESTDGLPDAGDFSVRSIAIDANDNSAVYATTNYGVYKSTDGGASWNRLILGMDDSLAQKIVPDPAAAGVLYLATAGAGVYKSTDGGANWTPTGGVPLLVSAGVTNAASYANGAVAPGEIVSIFVANAGPAEGVLAAFDPETGRLPTELAGVRVFFNDIPAPLFFVRSDQLNVQVPYEVAGLDAVELRIEYQGAVSSSVRIAVRDVHPGVFAPVLNQDATVNSEADPAVRGSVVVAFLTGQGAVTPAIESGQPAPGVLPLSTPLAEVRVLAKGEEAQLYAAVLTPGLVGLLQINFWLPPGLTGAVEIEVFIGGAASPTRATVFVE